MDVWTVICVGLAAAGYLVLQSAVGQSRTRSLVGAGLMAAGLVLAATGVGASASNLLFLAFAGLAIAGGIAFLVHRQSIHAALGFAISVLALCGLYFMQSAPFLAAATIIVYAGATIIIFLFVLMFAQRSVVESHDLRLSHPTAAAATAALLLVILTGAVLAPMGKANGPPTQTRPFSNEIRADEPSHVRGLGRSLYSDYLWGVELAGALLLVAAIGAIAIAQRSEEART